MIVQNHQSPHQGTKSKEKVIPFPEPERKLCHFCGQWRRRVVSFNLPQVIVDELPSKRAKLRLCDHCIRTLDTIATDTERNPGKRHG